MEIPTVALAIVALIALSFTSATMAKEVVSATPALCEPGILDEMPQHIRKVCLALENSNQLSTALNAYIRNQAAGKYGNTINLHVHLCHIMITIIIIHTTRVFPIGCLRTIFENRKNKIY